MSVNVVYVEGELEEDAVLLHGRSMRLTHGKLPLAERVEALPFLNIKYEVHSFDRLRTSGERAYTMVH